MNRYPNTTSTATLIDDLQEIQRLREEDISDRNNFQNIFVSGRKVDKVPTTSTDIDGNSEGDINYDTSYIYLCVESTATSSIVWRRIASSTF